MEEIKSIPIGTRVQVITDLARIHTGTIKSNKDRVLGIRTGMFTGVLVPYCQIDLVTVLESLPY